MNTYQEPRRLVLRRWTSPVLASMLGVTLGLAVGCHATVKEKYFLASPGADSHRNFYRVTVRGRAVASQARYVSGFFDEGAVEEYFGEFSQPEGGRLGSSRSNESEGTEEQLIDERLEHRSLVLMLSANSDAVAGQLGALAENEHVMEVLGRMLSRGDQEQIAARTQELVELEVRTDAFRARADALLNTGDSVRQADVMALANQLASILGASERFDDVQGLRRWLDARRDALRTEGR